MLLLLLPYSTTAALLVALLTVVFTYRKRLRTVMGSREMEKVQPQSASSNRRIPNTQSSQTTSTTSTSISSSSSAKTQLYHDKILYHQLQTLSSTPSCLSQARSRLSEFLDQVIHGETSRSGPAPETSILSIPNYDPEALHIFLRNSAARTDEEFAAYTARRKAGGPREMFPTRAYAIRWLRLAAPVKYVDGSWLGGIHRLLSTKLIHRRATRIAWQVLSEELGDGDLAKNHVWVYHRLIKQIGCGEIGLGHEARFTSNLHNPNNEERVWKAALAQLLVSLFPTHMLPEMLGFNMAYESLPCHILVTIQELKELDLDPYYFVLHVSIDNNHSGHAAMGAAAVTTYIDRLPQHERDEAWRRVQAGYLLADCLPTTPRPLTDLDHQVEGIFAEKCETAKPMHAFCPARIGGVGAFGKSLSDWLDPEGYKEWGYVFVKTLADSRWIEKGEPGKSKLIKELQWGGRMFGAYTTEEVGVIWRWIEAMPKLEMHRESMPEAKGAYARFTGVARDISSIPLPIFNPTTSPPDPRYNLFASGAIPPPRSLSYLLRNPPKLPSSLVGVKGPVLPSTIVGSLLVLSVMPFEYFPAYPSQISTPEGMSAIRTLRALYGFLPETDLCAGMDEVHRRPDEVIGVVELGMRLYDANAEGEFSASVEEVELAGEGLWRDSWGAAAPIRLRRMGEYIQRLRMYPVNELGRLLGIQLGFVWGLFLNNQIWGDDGGSPFAVHQQGVIAGTTINSGTTVKPGDALVTHKERDALERIGRRILAAWMPVGNMLESPRDEAVDVDGVIIGGGNNCNGNNDRQETGMDVSATIEWDHVLEGYMAVMELIIGEINAIGESDEVAATAAAGPTTPAEEMRKSRVMAMAGPLGERASSRPRMIGRYSTDDIRQVGGAYAAPPVRPFVLGGEAGGDVSPGAGGSGIASRRRIRY